MLTNEDIATISPTGRPFRIRVDKCLFLEVSPKGGKWWRYRFQFNGKANMLSLGIFPDVGVAEAIARRDDLRGLTREGINPSSWTKLQKAKSQAQATALQAQIDAERLALVPKAKIRASEYGDGSIEFGRGKARIRFTHDEAVFLKGLLDKLLS
jgi:hypothetical protein